MKARIIDIRYFDTYDTIRLNHLLQFLILEPYVIQSLTFRTDTFTNYCF